MDPDISQVNNNNKSLFQKQLQYAGGLILIVYIHLREGSCAPQCHETFTILCLYWCLSKKIKNQLKVKKK